MLSLILCVSVLASCNDCDNKTSNTSVEYELVGCNSAWCNDLNATLSKLKVEGVFDEHFMDGYALALFDIDNDGIPEIIEAEASGSSGGVLYIAYDMKTGKVEADFTGGVFHSEHSEVWCVYRDIETNTYKIIENSTTRGGSTGFTRHISELQYDTNTYECTEKSLFSISYNIEETVVDNELVEDTVTVYHYYNGERVTASEYNYQYDLFIASHIRIPETGMKLIRWVDVEDKNNPDASVNNMVEALFSSGQKFVNVIDGGENEQ